MTDNDWLLGSDNKKLKLKNGAIDVELRDYNGKLVQLAQIDTATWYPTEEFNDKGKRIFACGGTGRWLIALDFRGAMEGVVLNNPGDINDPYNPAEGKQWTASPAAPAVPLPEDATAKAEVLEAIGDNPAIEDWLVEINTNSVGGGTSISNFTGSKEAVELCYLLNNEVLDANVTTNAAVELKIPSISFDPTTGNVIIDGELLIHNTKVSRTVNGKVRLYYANSLEALEASENYIELYPSMFPLNDKDAGTTENIPARFYRLKIE